MNATAIKQLCNTQAPTIFLDENIYTALNLLEETHSDAVVILDKNSKPIGIITERDIAKKAGHWDEFLTKSVSSIMSSPVVTLRETTDFTEAYMTMSEHGFRHIAVVDENDKLIGVLGEGDFLKHLTLEQLLGVKEVEQVMSKEVTTASEDETVAQIIKTMTTHKLSSIVIAKDNKPLGIFTERDAVHLARHGDKNLLESIKKYMVSPVRTIEQNDSVLEAERILEQEKIRRLVVVDKQGELVGILTQHDLVKGISGLYVKMLRDTIHKQSDMLHDSYNRLEEQSVLNNILYSFSDRLIVACDMNSVVQYTNTGAIESSLSIPDKGKPLDKNVKCFDENIATSILNGDVNKIINSTATVVSKDGSICFFKTSYAPIFSKQKLLQGLLFSAEDVTNEQKAYNDLKISNDKLEQSEQRFKKIFDSAHDGILITDIKSKNFHMGNQAICEMLGYTSDEIKMLGVEDIHPQEVLEEVFENIKKQISGERKTVKDVPVIRKNSSIFYADISAEMIMVDNQTWIVGIFHDIIERKEYEQLLETKNMQLKEREAQLLQAQELAQIGNWSLDVSTMEAAWSDEIREICGIDTDVSMSPEFLSHIVHPDDWTNLYTSLMATAYSGKVHHIEYRIKRNTDNETRWVDCRGMRITDKNNIVKVVGTFQDITEKKELAIKTEESEILFRAIVEQATVGVAQLDTKTGRFIKVNQRYCDIVGLSEEEMYKTNFMSITHPDDLKEDLDNFKLLKTGAINEYRMKKRYLKSDGTLVWVNLHVSPLFWKENELQSHVAIIEDITQETNNSIALKRSEEILIESQKIVHIGSFEHSIDLSEVYWTEELFHIFGFDALQAVPDFEIFMQRVHPDDTQKLEKHIMRLENEAHKDNVEFRYYLPDGSMKYMRSFIEKLFDKIHDSYFARGTVQDITEQKEREYSLVRSEERYKELFEGINDAVFVHPYSEEGFHQFVEVNDVACKRLGYTKEELLQLSPIDITLKDDVEKHANASNRKELLENGYMIFQTHHKTKNGESIAVEISSRIIFIDKKKLVMSMARDISERKIAEKKLQEQEDIMISQSRQAAMGEMISMIAHQWRQPISVVSMAANNILLDIELDELKEENVIKGLGEINTQVQYMSHTIDDFRNFFQSSKTITKEKLVNVIQSVIKIIGPALQQNNIEMKVDCEESIMLETYQSELTQVIINLLSNAKDALQNTKTDKTINIDVKELDDTVIFSISNNGPKIPKEILNTIFEPYFTTKEKSGGTGLGLYMSKSIIEKHMGGSIQVENLNDGVKFTISILKELKEM